MKLYIPSVDQAAKMIVSAYSDENFERLWDVKEYLENQTVSYTISGDADEFHNAAVALARVDFYDYAVALLEIGHARYRTNTDILGDILGYGIKCRTKDNLAQYYRTLSSIPYENWTWRAFTFAFDYLLDDLRNTVDKNKNAAIAKGIEVLLMEYKENASQFEDQSDRQKAYMAEYEYYMYRRDINQAMRALDECIELLPNKCSQCALKKADYFFEKGDYEKVIEPAKIAVQVRETQPSISLGYTYFILALSLENTEKTKGGSFDEKRIKPIYNAYNAAIIHMEPSRTNLLSQIKKNVSSLEYEFSIESNISFPDLQSGKGGKAFTTDQLKNLFMKLQSD